MKYVAGLEPVTLCNHRSARFTGLAVTMERRYGHTSTLKHNPPFGLHHSQVKMLY